MSGLTRGHEVTVWFVIFNEPQTCTHGEGPYRCGPGDRRTFDARKGRPASRAAPSASARQLMASMLRSTTSIVFASSSVGWNSTTSVPAKISAVWPGLA